MAYIGRSEGFALAFNPGKPSLYASELTTLCSNYSRSDVTLGLIRQDVKAYGCNQLDAPNDPLMILAIQDAFHAFELWDPVPMIHLNDVFSKDLNIWSSSPGLPYIKRGFTNKGQIRDDPEEVKNIRWFWHRIKRGESLSPPDACAFVRSQIVQDDETKARAVWGLPAAMVFGEAVFALPLIDAYKRGPSPIAYGFETAVGGCRKIRDKISAPWYLGVDFKCFDKDVPAWLINVAFDILKYNIDFRHYDGHGIPKLPYSVRAFEYIRHHFINTVIRLPNGERYRKRAGIASGSYFTQLVGSIINYILIKYICLSAGVTPIGLTVFGDDSICGLDSYLSIHKISAIVEPLGFTVNIAKSMISSSIDELSFLGYQINCGLPFKARGKLFAGLVYPERPDRCWDDFASRALGHLYANLGVDSLFDEVCRRIVTAQPFVLRLSRDMQRFLLMIGVDIKCEPPDRLEFFRRLLIA